MPLFDEKSKNDTHVLLPIGVSISTVPRHEGKAEGVIVSSISQDAKMQFVNEVWPKGQEGPISMPLEIKEDSDHDFELVFGTLNELTAETALFRSMLPVNNKISFLFKYTAKSFFGFHGEIEFIDFSEQNVLSLFRFNDLPRYADMITAQQLMKQLHDDLRKILSKHSALVMAEDYKPKSSFLCCR